MDVLRPPLININGRIYRRNFIKEQHYEEEEDFSYMGPGRFNPSELTAEMHVCTELLVSFLLRANNTMMK